MARRQVEATGAHYDQAESSLPCLPAASCPGRFDPSPVANRLPSNRGRGFGWHQASSPTSLLVPRLTFQQTV